MTHQAPPPPAPSGADPGRQLARLREVLRLVERIAGREGAASAESRLDEAARVSAAFDAAAPVARRRFEALVEETAIWAAAGVEALLAAEDARPAQAAGRLADSLERALDDLAALLR